MSPHTCSVQSVSEEGDEVSCSEQRRSAKGFQRTGSYCLRMADENEAEVRAVLASMPKDEDSFRYYKFKHLVKALRRKNEERKDEDREEEQRIREA